MSVLLEATAAAFGVAQQPARATIAGVVTDTTPGPTLFGVISSAEPRFTDAVRAAIEKAGFIPASRRGKRVRQLVQQRVRFELPS